MCVCLFIMGAPILIETTINPYYTAEFYEPKTNVIQISFALIYVTKKKKKKKNDWSFDFIAMGNFQFHFYYVHTSIPSFRSNFNTIKETKRRTQTHTHTLLICEKSERDWELHTNCWFRSKLTFCYNTKYILFQSFCQNESRSTTRRRKKVEEEKSANNKAVG